NYSDENYIQSLSPSSTSNWCTDADQASCYDQSRLNSNNTTSPVGSLTDPTSQNVYGYGNYYNWYSATAGYGKQEDGTNNTSEDYSICPYSWKLPSGGRSANANNSDFWQLGLNIMGKAPYNNLNYQNINDDKAILNSASANAAFVGEYATKIYRRYPNNFIYSGHQWGSDTLGRNENSDYWSSTALNTMDVYILSFNKTVVKSGTNQGGKYGGWSVRCLIGN
ncbi:hypothetical protein IKE79_00990, partial [Candidatus Saccharibacteria bacterium]|nr:hypothetical protein [Candidatus Saccharibacteria bacterium]